jgi:uncharacterized RDD family membrane protein YckC
LLVESNGPAPEAAITESPSSNAQIAGFWRRVAAALIDGILLGVVGIVLGLFFSEQFMRMGGWGRLAGAAIAALYFVPLNSWLGGGQTVGKRALRIRVVSTSGGLLGVPQSLLRSVVMLLPWFLNGAPIPTPLLMSPLGIVVSLALFGFGASILYLIVFNRRTRQSFHDLIAGSYVIRAGTEQPPKHPVWRGHYVVVAVILALAAIVPVAAGRLAQRTMFKNLEGTYAAFMAEPEVTTASVFAGNNYVWSGGSTRATSVVSALIRLNRHIEDKAAEAGKFARIVLETFPEAGSHDLISVVLAEGYDIGIASKFSTNVFPYSPAKWREQLAGPVSNGVSATPAPIPPQ